MPCYKHGISFYTFAAFYHALDSHFIYIDIS